jgi:hypothetical protein
MFTKVCCFAQKQNFAANLYERARIFKWIFAAFTADSENRFTYRIFVQSRVYIAEPEPAFLKLS